jgi:hypothetical protein|tara:strand:- start:887 stop:1747 length:861 start_codon:yes stop_codon:yes gene_type:complete
MPTNVYFDTGTRPEQHLYEDLIIEQLRIYGQDVYYIPRNMVSEDSLFGEDTLSKFEDAYLIEMYVDNADGYEGEKELMSKFGLDIQDDATFTVSRRRWEQFVSVDNNIIVNLRPNEGDLVFWPKGNKLFEITFVDHDDPFYQVHNLPTYKLKCKSFEYGSEQIDTGIAAIDSIEDDNSLDQLSHQTSLEQTGTFNENVSLEDGTLLMQEDGSTGAGLGDNIISEDETHGGYIQAENAVQGAVASYIIQETYKVDTIDENAMNDFFDTAEDSILDFSESNPFGDAGK